MPKRGRANGEGSTPRKRKDGRWQANYTVYLGGARKLKSVYGWTRAECSAKLAKAIAERDGGVVFDSKNIALGGYLERWLTNSVQDSVKQRTYDGYAYIARKHIIPELGRVRLKDLTSEHIQALYRHKLDSGLSNRTVRYIYQTLNPALKQAVRWRLIAFNLAEETKKSGMVLRQGGEPPSPQVIYAFIESQKASHRVSAMCRTLKVSKKSGFYGWRDRPPSDRARADAILLEKIAHIHTDSRQTYGAPRIHFELRVLGERCARKRVAKLMRESGLFGCGGRRRKICTTHRSPTERTPPAPDLGERNFTPEAPDRLWVADITYVRCGEGFVYLAFILDACSRRVVGWSMATHLRTELVIDALQMAIARRKPAPGLVHHSDRGVQYTSLSFGKRLEDEELLPSMGRVGSAYDNALAESFIATLKTELLYRNTWPTRQAARTAIFEYIEGFYNPRRRHSALGYLSPAEFEEVRLVEEDAA